MTLRHLAISNIKGNWHRYLAYFLSCTFSVFVFYLFLSFVLHPAVVNGHIVRDGREAVQRGLLASEVVILVFSFVFILYSTNAFLRSRKQEFGLLTLLGMTQRQQRRMVWLEYVVISILSIAVGLMSGILFSKLFFMAMSVLLAVANPIYFYVPQLAVLITAAIFTAVFALLSVVAVFHLRQSSVRELLVAKRQAKKLPRWRPLIFILGIFLVAWGYTKAWHTDMRNLTQNMLPILVLVIVGTYFVVGQGGVAACRWLERKGGIYFRGTNMITLNRLTFRLRENARVIFTSAILIAVVCTALGTFNTLLQSARSMALDEYAFAVMAQTNGVPETELAGVGEQIAVSLERSLGERVDWQHITALPASLQLNGYDESIAIVSEQDYVAATKIAPHLPTISLGAQDAVFFFISDEKAAGPQGKGAASVANNTFYLQQIEYVNQSLLYFHRALVVPDATYQQLALGSDRQDLLHHLCFETRNWQKLSNAQDIVVDTLPDGLSWVVDRASMYATMRSTGALTMFIGVFVSFLFFIASGSLLYFKLFTEIDVDKRQHTTLHDIGITRRERLRIVNQELGVIFFLPVAIGALHTTFAMKTLSNLWPQLTVIPASAMVAGTYALLQLIYFILARKAYLKQLQS